MEPVRGSILDGDNVILNGVEVSLNVTADRTGHGTWEGDFYLPSGPCNLDLRGFYRLVLEDGRSGDIQVAGGQLSTSHVLFTGSGPLR
jgi:hypothetical protein